MRHARRLGYGLAVMAGLFFGGRLVADVLALRLVQGPLVGGAFLLITAYLVGWVSLDWD